MSLPIGVVAFLVGLLIAAPLYLLRQAVDRNRGLFTEVIAVCMPLFAACLIVAAIGNYDNSQEFGLRVAPVVELVFISLPIFVAIRLIEKVRRGYRLLIADLFRATTAIAMMLFAVMSLHNPTIFPVILLVCFVFCAADIASTSAKPERNLAIVFSLSFLIAIFAGIDGDQNLLELIPRDWVKMDRDFVGSREGTIALMLFLSAVIWTPTWIRLFSANATWLHKLAVAIAVWQLPKGNQPVSISTRPFMAMWHFRDEVCFLNHGSFGAVPLTIRSAQKKIRAECEDEPMDFLARQLEPRWLDARFKLATWLGTKAENIAFCENATAAMNEIAYWFPLQEGDEVLMNDHEYGAVRRIWQRRCAQRGARLIEATLPMPFTTREQIVDAILSATTPQTKLVILSHITSPTAILLPIEELCHKLHERGIATCIDGPHAILQEPLKLHRLNCDFYTASCHKWLCAPIGSGFVYAQPKWHATIQSARLSWGRLQPATPQSWTDELLWTGTRDHSPYLTVPHAIRFFEQFDLPKLDDRNHALACYARDQLCTIPGAEPVTPAGREWFGWMVGVWLPAGNYSALQQTLWTKYKIEVPIVHFQGRTLVRVSCHLYNTTQDIDHLMQALKAELARAR